MLIPFEMFNAAYLCSNRKMSAGVNRTILITGDSRLVGTDRHNMYVSNPLAELTPRKFVVFEKPKAALLVRLEETAAVGLDAGLTELWRVPIAPNLNDFPKWDRVAGLEIVTDNSAPLVWPLSALKMAVKIFADDPRVKFEAGGAHAPTRITGRHGALWVMPSPHKMI